jgi:hypothetical protein
MSDWIGAALLGACGVGLVFLLASLKGISPRRLAWQDLSRVRKPDADERHILRGHVRRSLTIYVPVLIGAVVVSGLMIADGMPLGLAVLICFGVPPSLALVRAVRVLRFLDET